MSRWQESIDLTPGRPPTVGGTPAGDVVYAFPVQGGIMRDELWLPPPGTGLALRCTKDGGVFVAQVWLRRARRRG